GSSSCSNAPPAWPPFSTPSSPSSRWTSRPPARTSLLSSTRWSLRSWSRHARAVLRRLAALDARRRALLAYGLGWVLIAKAAVNVPRATLPRRQRALDWIAARLPAPPRCTEREAAWAITAAAPPLPG